MLITIFLTALLIWMNKVETLAQFGAFILFQFFIWILMKQL